MWAAVGFVAALVVFFGGGFVFQVYRARRYGRMTDEEREAAWRALGGPVTAPLARWHAGLERSCHPALS